MPIETGESAGNPWTVLTSTTRYENAWMEVIEHKVLTPKGVPGIYGVVHPRSIATGVVPIHEDGSVTLVGQYRFPLQQYSWEIPEGGGRKGVEPQESAARELREETGLTARRWMPLMTLHLSNCLTDEVAHTFVAWDLEQGLSAPDETEVLAVRRVPFAEVIDMVMAGAITDAMAVASLLKLRVLAAEEALPDDLARRLRV
ncbi:DNA mismatch repair protein MutT [Azospirillum thiophilum]|uniref:GDP-mannose pyrophosphatase n=1 Tax=Azospirillum thiophilum TaxID=528244 RepID=A0AAC9EX75_9PROT|nr:NUDIX hydrolase [Azospirillum thiophilum]ALG70661.1 DNA mismatch repair protein MutT [Azospirillum thiophilum]KJR65670.1 DNA mismatch repair protein MutT [Azospirillum thiophilum]